MVTSPSVFTFVELEVNLNTLLPTLHLGGIVNPGPVGIILGSLGAGKANTPEAVPAELVVKAAPAL